MYYVIALMIYYREVLSIKQHMGW